MQNEIICNGKKWTSNKSYFYDFPQLLPLTLLRYDWLTSGVTKQTCIREFYYDERSLFILLFFWTEIKDEHPRGGGGNSGFSLVPMREQGFWKTPLNAYIAMGKYTLNAYIIFFKNTPFYAFLGIFSTKLPLLTRFCLPKCVHEYWQTKLNIYIHFWHFRSNKRPVIKKKNSLKFAFLSAMLRRLLRRNMNISKRKLSRESENTDEVLSMWPPVTPSS